MLFDFNILWHLYLSDHLKWHVPVDYFLSLDEDRLLHFFNLLNLLYFLHFNYFLNLDKDLFLYLHHNFLDDLNFYLYWHFLDNLYDFLPLDDDLLDSFDRDFLLYFFDNYLWNLSDHFSVNWNHLFNDNLLDYRYFFGDYNLFKHFNFSNHLDLFYLFLDDRYFCWNLDDLIVSLESDFYWNL